MQSLSRLTDKRFYGVEEGLVTSVAQDMSKEGRLMVKLVRHEVEVECRMSNAYAGNGYGFYFVPQVGDEVLVAFTQGDMRLPMIIGGLYNGKDKPPVEDPQLRCIKTPSGHQLIFVDAPDGSGNTGGVVIQDAYGNIITMSNGKITIKSKGVLEIDASVITLQGPGYRRVVSPNNNPI
jgi:phage baseplate assembly protein gpV